MTTRDFGNGSISIEFFFSCFLAMLRMICKWVSYVMLVMYLLMIKAASV